MVGVDAAKCPYCSLPLSGQNPTQTSTSIATAASPAAARWSVKADAPGLRSMGVFIEYVAWVAVPAWLIIGVAVGGLGGVAFAFAGVFSALLMVTIGRAVRVLSDYMLTRVG